MSAADFLVEQFYILFEKPRYFGGVCAAVRGVPWYNAYSLPIISYQEFFNDSDNFLAKGFKRLGNAFVFRFLSHKVIAINSEEGRKRFYQLKSMNLKKGWDALRNPGISERKDPISLSDESRDMAGFVKRVPMVFSNDNLNHAIPLIFQDLERCTAPWGAEGSFDPWDQYYIIIMQLVIRLGYIRELADSPKLVKRIAFLYKELENTQTFGSEFFPWLAKKEVEKRKIMFTELWEILGGVVERKIETMKKDMREEGKVNDLMRMFIERGDDGTTLVEFFHIVLFAGIPNIYKTSCWLTAYLSVNPLWKTLVNDELHGLLSDLPTTSNSSIIDRLSQVGLEAWEKKTPVLDNCIRETIRFVFSGASLRKFVGDQSIHLDERTVVNPGDCVVVSSAYIHMDPRIYPQPEIWDPSRHERGEDMKEQMAYLGWGAGRHMCPGKRPAQLLIKLLISYIFLQYDCNVENGLGRLIDTLPEPDKSQKIFALPMSPVYVRYTRKQ